MPAFSASVYGLRESTGMPYVHEAAGVCNAGIVQLIVFNSPCIDVLKWQDMRTCPGFKVGALSTLRLSSTQVIIVWQV